MSDDMLWALVTRRTVLPVAICATAFLAWHLAPRIARAIDRRVCWFPVVTDGMGTTP